MTRMRSSQALTQDKTPTATRASESAARIGRTDKSNNQLDDDGERGWGSGRKQHRQQQHGRATAVNFGKMADDRQRGDNGGDHIRPLEAPCRQMAKSHIGYRGNTMP